MTFTDYEYVAVPNLYVRLAFVSVDLVELCLCLSYRSGSTIMQKAVKPCLVILFILPTISAY